MYMMEFGLGITVFLDTYARDPPRKGKAFISRKGPNLARRRCQRRDISRENEDENDDSQEKGGGVAASVQEERQVGHVWVQGCKRTDAEKHGDDSDHSHGRVGDI